MLYIFIDYVFDNKGTEHWKPDGSVQKVINVYGQSKLEGELAIAGLVNKCFIVCIAWMFG